ARAARQGGGDPQGHPPQALRDPRRGVGLPGPILAAQPVPGNANKRLRGAMEAATAPQNAFDEITDEQKAILEMVHQFVDEQIIPNAEEYDHEDKFPEPIVEQMKELGLFGVMIPEEYGGMGLDLSTYELIVEELSRGWISISGVVNTHFIGSSLLVELSTPCPQPTFL